MAIPENDETYLDRLLTSEQAAGLPHILNLDPDVNVRREDYRSLSDAYNYYLGGGRDAAQADFPIQASGITAQGPISPVMDSDRTAEIVTQQRASGVPEEGLITNFAPTVEQTAATEDIGATTTMKDILDDQYAFEDARTQQLRPASTIPTDYEAEAYGAPDTIESLTAATRMPTDYEAEAYGAPDTIASLQDVTPEAQGAWQKVQSGLASAGDFIQNYGMATYNFLAGNTMAGLAGLAGGPLGLGLTAGLGALQTTPEQKAMQSAAQASGIADPNDPRKDVYGTNIVSAFGDYDQSVADSIATLEESGANPEKLAALKNYQNEKAWEDVDTDMARDEAITSPMVTELPTAEDYGDPTIMDAPDLPIDSRIADYRDPIMDMVPEQKTALDLAKGQPVFDEKLGWIDPVTELPVEDPKKIETDIALAGDPVTTKLEKQKETIEALKKSDAWEFLSEEQKEQKEKELEKINNQLKKTPKVQKTSLVDLTDTGIVEEATDGNISTEEIRDLAESGDLGQVARTDENISKAVDVLAEQYDQQRGPHEDPTTTSKVNKAKAQIDMPQHLGDVGQGDPTGGRDEPAPSRPGGAPASGPHGNGGSGNGGGKIVCTMMNDSYGFGSFRNKIWLRQSKNLAPEYQIGYHKIFLPLVKLSKKNIVLKKILEHIAIHRTIDIRQEARGKTHMLGRLYRKVLEPICYWVGKYGKRT